MKIFSNLDCRAKAVTIDDAKALVTPLVLCKGATDEIIYFLR
jgi:hypothetical protein